MMSHRTHCITGALGLGVLLWALLANAAGSAVDGDWESGSNGEIPTTAIALGRESDGRPQFACRASYARGVHVGKIVAGIGGCAIGIGGREVIVPRYEVLVTRGATSLVRPRTGVLSTPSAAVAEKEKLVVARGPALTGMASASGGGGPIRRGFDDKGQPYLEERKPDGTIVRSMPNGVQVTKPDGTPHFTPYQRTYSNAQPPTPPELPGDPARGRAWIDLHNQALLSVISALVRGDDAEMKRFAAAEAAKTNGDLFRQITYRTQIATFLAKDR